MNTIYEIITSIRNAKGDLEKQALLHENADNELFKEFMRVTYDPSINYYMKKCPKVPAGDFATLDAEYLQWMVENIAGRVYTGKAAVTHLKMTMACLDNESQELVEMILKRSIGASVGDTMVLKTWPKLFFTVPYQRCSLLDVKAKERLAKLSWFYVQTKRDGSFAYVLRRLDGTAEAITRAGNKYPKEFAEKMAYGLKPGNVLVGELEVYESNEGIGCQLLSRKDGNGILNSVLKDGDGLKINQSVTMVAWDLLTIAEFEAGKSTRRYEDRLEHLEYEVMPLEARQVEIVETHVVRSLEEAFEIYTDHTSRGLEGVIAKDPDDLWKDGTSKGAIKMKIKFEAEYLCTGIYEGEGEMVGMLGGISFTTRDKLLGNNCGIGFSKQQRIDFFNSPSLIVGRAVMLSANDITQSRDSRKLPALSLCVFEEVRYDKKGVADTYEHVVAQLEAAKQGK
jgi:hypothetical protein